MKNLVAATNRQFYLDWIRVLAMLGVFFFHNARIFDIGSDWHVKNATLSLAATGLVAFMSQWLMPLFFLVSGAGIYYALKSRNLGEFVKERGLISIYIFLILFGIGNGAPGTLNILLRGRYFGRKSYGMATGFTSVLTAPVGLIAPIYAGWIFDTTGSYTIAFWSFAAFTLLSTILALFIRPPKKIPHQILATPG